MLHQLPRLVDRAKRPGRGIAAGQGKTAGRGTKGQKARSGYRIPLGFEGGQQRLIRRLPKRRGLGFQARGNVATVTLRALDQAYADGERVTLRSLRAKGLIAGKASSAKVVATGTLAKSLKFSGLKFTKSVYDQLYGMGK